MRISNDGPRITTTDYWSTEHARRGLLYLSVNAGRVRLLVPDAAAALIGETAGATRAAVQLAGASAVGVVHIVWDDGTDAPYRVTLDVRQCDRVLPSNEAGRWVSLALYRPGPTGGDSVTLVREMPALIRAATIAPNLAAIPEPPQ